MDVINCSLCNYSLYFMHITVFGRSGNSFNVLISSSVWSTTDVWCVRKQETHSIPPRSSEVHTTYTCIFLIDRHRKLRSTPRFNPWRFWGGEIWMRTISSFSDCLFQITPMNRYAAQNQFLKAAKQSGGRTDPVLLRRLHVSCQLWRHTNTGWSDRIIGKTALVNQSKFMS